MPRLVRLYHNGPIKVESSGKPISICACGLSRTFPICDGAHKAAKIAETDPTALYVYDADRRAILEARRDQPPIEAPLPLPSPPVVLAPAPAPAPPAPAQP
jgi:CDGSH-type Zn-finger protein